MARYAKVVSVMYIDLEVLERNAGDLAFDLTDDRVEDARYMVEARLEDIIAGAGLQVDATPVSRLPRNI